MDKTRLNMMSAFEFVDHQRWPGYTNFRELAQLRHNVTGAFDGYVQFAAFLTDTDVDWLALDWRAFVGVGVGYKFTPNFGIEIGSDFLVNQEPDQFFLNSTITARF